METKNTSNSNKNKRVDSTVKYIDDLSKEYSKLNVVRVDLFYKKPYSDKITLEDANNDINRMMNNRRSKPSVFKDQIGYVVKREFTEDKGVHFHTMFIYDGQKVQKDAFKGYQIGKYWEQSITKDKGRYHNCNRNNYEHSGIGMIDHRNIDKRNILNDVVVPYMCKDVQEVIKVNKKDRAFTRGVVVAKDKGNMGRPRKKSVE